MYICVLGAGEGHFHKYLLICCFGYVALLAQTRERSFSGHGERAKRFFARETDRPVVPTFPRFRYVSIPCAILMLSDSSKLKEWWLNSSDISLQDKRDLCALNSGFEQLEKLSQFDTLPLGFFPAL